MKIRISLHNSGGELDQIVIDGSDDDDNQAADALAIQEVIDTWVLSVGNTIKIEEV
jgi:hypothetical protein